MCGGAQSDAATKGGELTGHWQQRDRPQEGGAWPWPRDHLACPSAVVTVWAHFFEAADPFGGVILGGLLPFWANFGLLWPF